MLNTNKEILITAILSTVLLLIANSIPLYKNFIKIRTDSAVNDNSIIRYSTYYLITLIYYFVSMLIGFYILSFFINRLI